MSKTDKEKEKETGKAPETPEETGTITSQPGAAPLPVEEVADLSEVQEEDLPYEGETYQEQADRIQRESNLEQKKYSGPPVDAGEFNADPPEAKE